MKKVKTYFPTILVAGVILYGSLLRDVCFPMEDVLSHTDKVVHFIFYALLAFVFIRSLIIDGFSICKATILGISVPILYGGLIELLQEYYFPPRKGDVWDWLSDILGVLIGYFVVCLCRKRMS